MQRNNFIAAMLEKHLADWDEYYPRVYDYAFPAMAALTGSPAGVQAQSILTIEQDAPFVICGFSAQLWNAAFVNQAAGAATPIYEPTQIIADIDLQIFDSGASNYLSNAALPIRSYMGQAGSDMRELVVPYLVERNTNLTLSATSFDTRTFDVTVIAHGFKIIKRMNPVRNGHRDLMQAQGRR